MKVGAVHLAGISIDAEHGVDGRVPRQNTQRLTGRAHAGKRRRHNQRKHHRRLGIHLDALAVQLDLAPAHRLVWPGAGVAAVEFLRCVDVHGTLGPVAHQVRIGNVVLDKPAAQHNHARALRPHGKRVDPADVLDNVDAHLGRRRLEGVEVQHVAQAAIRQRRAEDGNVVFPGPVVDRALVVDRLAQTVNDLARRPVQRLVRRLAGLLLGEHRVEDGHHPVLKGTVVAVGHHQVADAIHPFGPQPCSRRRKRPHVRGCQAFDQVLLHTAGCRDNRRHVLMLH